MGKEFTFDVDMSQLGCGLNGALYLSAMPLDGGLSTQTNNKAGAKYAATCRSPWRASDPRTGTVPATATRNARKTSR
jgi:hypothetical protein